MFLWMRIQVTQLGFTHGLHTSVAGVAVWTGAFDGEGQWFSTGSALIYSLSGVNEQQAAALTPRQSVALFSPRLRNFPSEFLRVCVRARWRLFRSLNCWMNEPSLWFCNSSAPVQPCAGLIDAINDRDARLPPPPPEDWAHEERPQNPIFDCQSSATAPACRVCLFTQRLRKIAQSVCKGWEGHMWKKCT